MHFTPLLGLCTVWGSIVFASPTARHVLHERRSLDHKWEREQKLPSDVVLPMRIGLTQQNHHKTSEFLDQVSHPESADYGKHWTTKQIAETFSPSAETKAAVEEWLSQNSISPDRHSHRRTNWLEVNVTAQEAEKLLRTEYFVHLHEGSGIRKVACDEYWVPEALRKHIDYITPTVHFDTSVVERKIEGGKTESNLDKRYIPFSSTPAAPPCPSCPPAENPGNPKEYIGSCQEATTPACVRALYGIPDPSTLPIYHGERVPLGMLEFASFIEYPPDLNDFFVRYTNIPNGTIPRTVSIGQTVPPPPLPVIGGNQPNTSSYNFFEPNGDFEISMSILGADDVVLYELGPGYQIENFLDGFDDTYCADDGPDGCGSVKGADLPYVVSISYTVAETSTSVTPALLQRQCNEIGKLGLMGITVLAASGDAGVGWVCTDPATGQGYPGDENLPNGSQRGLFTANFPASCPFVTAVGATAIPEDPAFYPGMREVAAYKFSSIGDSYRPGFYSGGGFSNVFAAQTYQQSALQHYHSTASPQYPSFEGVVKYNDTGTTRGYPDISANGFQFSIYSNLTNQAFSGTSGSTPMVAAVIALLNGERFSTGKGPIGFINPALYQNPDMLNDIFIGNNPGCGTPGFSAVAGWDPVTGLGTPNYPAMSKYFNSLK